MGFHPCHQLQRIKGLGHIVIRSDVQPEDLIRILRFGRQYNDGNAAVFPDFQCGMYSVQPRHHDIDNEQMDFIGLKRPDRLLPVISFNHMIALLRKINLYRFHYLFIVIAYQNIRHLQSLLPQSFSAAFLRF